ncbi:MULTISPECIES: sugar ABC transporter permease [unclassified Nocardioides]|uniref:carbohydrate ABC transporter permease n=1 Tax=unclassified Nocardioides TaxID=2615069 RepID=UPI000056F2BC|nr:MULTISPECIES: sugar ABC transporter permease [unclassified Nocardioides]ABL83182.1 carbohydrate ABC transporter membrane protein 1, CUT1 family [Nocardioides sp. JS614]
MSVRIRMMLPLVVVLAAVVGYPLAYSFYLSLTDYKITSRGDVAFRGLEQYDNALNDPDYVQALLTTGTFVVSAVVLELAIGMLLALALQQQRWVRNLSRSFLLAPMFITPIAVGLMFRFLLNSQLGAIPSLLNGLGVSMDFFGSGTALWTIVAIDVWQWTPFMMLMLLAGLEGLPKQPFEAARVDGASALFTFRKVTIPLLRPVIVVAVLIRSLDALKVFEYVYATTRGGPGTETQTIQYLIYNTGITFFRLASASAMAYLLLAAVVVLAVLLFARIRRGGVL